MSDPAVRSAGPDDDFGSSIPLGASYFRFPTVRNVLSIEDFTAAEVALTHEVTAFRNQIRAGETRSFRIHLGTHLNASVNPLSRQRLKRLAAIKDLPNPLRAEASMFAERIQVGYQFDGTVVQRGPGKEAFAPVTKIELVTDTTSSETKLSIGFPGLSGSFDVKHQVTISVTDWLVSLNPADSQVIWDYWVNTPWSVKNAEPPNDVQRYPNLSLVGFSFDTSAWFEVQGSEPRVVTFQPVLQASVASFRFFGGDRRDLKRITRGDANLPVGPFFQAPIPVDLSKVPNLKPT